MPGTAEWDSVSAMSWLPRRSPLLLIGLVPGCGPDWDALLRGAAGGADAGLERPPESNSTGGERLLRPLPDAASPDAGDAGGVEFEKAR